ncbi:hypothetical protein ACU635_27450 [[Actinomadura] parvosata]|uniref:hypothetical protein n=1 Tax=[Actinomadura] parvosata TaxID=1955412 RepID=UPI00406D28E4
MSGAKDGLRIVAAPAGQWYEPDTGGCHLDTAGEAAAGEAAAAEATGTEAAGAEADNEDAAGDGPGAPDRPDVPDATRR